MPVVSVTARENLHTLLLIPPHSPLSLVIATAIFLPTSTPASDL